MYSSVSFIITTFGFRIKILRKATFLIKVELLCLCSGMSLASRMSPSIKGKSLYNFRAMAYLVASWWS